MDKYILTKGDIDSHEGIKKTHFLNDNAQRVNKSLGDLTGLTGFAFHIIEVQPGDQTTEMHKHYHEDECVYILEGQAEATIGNDVYIVKAGDFIGYRAGGLAHTLFNNGDCVLKCIVGGQRLDRDVGDYTNLNKRIYRQKGLPWNVINIDEIDEPKKTNIGKK